MRILTIGNDGRAHALVWKLLNSQAVSEVICTPGNGGTAPLTATVDFGESDTAQIARWCFDEAFELVVPASTVPLHAGLADEALSLHVGVCGPPQRTVALEQSRCRIKEFALRYSIPTAPGRPFDDLSVAEKFLATQPLPVIIKADHPAGGEQVYTDRYAAIEGLRTLFAARPLEATRGGVVIESFLPGPRVALSAFTDGQTVIPMLAVRIYDRPDTANIGPIAVGIGAHTGSSKFAQQLTDYMQRKFIEPIMAGLQKEQLPSWGILGIDCIVTADGPRLTGLRFAMREGEAQVVLPRLEDDLLPWIQAMIARRLHDLPAPRWSSTPSVGLGLFARGYPVSFPYGSTIKGVEELDPGILVFHSSTANPGAEFHYTPQNRGGFGQMLGQLFRMGGTVGNTALHTTGGLVLTLVAQGATLAGARGRALINAERILFDARTFREDIAAKEFA